MNNIATSEIILESAKEVFQKAGFCDTDVSDITGLAKISKKDFKGHFEDKHSCCLKVIKSYEKEVKKKIAVYEEHDNPRQRLSLFLDQYFDNAEQIAKEGDPVLNLYYDLRNMNDELSKAVENIIKFQHNWVDQQFITMLKTESAVDQGDRLMAALTGLLLLVKVKNNPDMFKSQLIQLKSWIRTM